MSLVRHNKPEEQQTKMLQVRRNECRAAQQHIQPISAVFEDLYKRGHVLGFEGRTGEDQIDPLGLEIEYLKGENHP